MDPYDTFEALNGAKGIKLVHLNTRSLLKKIDQIRVLLSGLDTDETWLKPHLSMSTVELKGFKAFRQDRELRSGKTKRGGGLIYIHK